MKKVKTLALVLILLVSTFAFFACNNVESSFTDVYVNHESAKEFTSYKEVISAVPAGWEIYTPSISSSEYKYSNSGYISDMDAFVVKKTVDKNVTYLSIIKCGTTELMFAESLAITAFRVSNGLIIVKNASGDMYVTDYDGKVVFKDIVSGASNKYIDDVIKVLDNELVAVNPAYDKNAGSNKSYTSIYRVSTGTVATRIKNSGGALSAIKGFDGKYAVTTGTAEEGVEISRIFTIPQSGDVVNNDGTEKGSYYDNDEENYYNEITYMGEGKFFIHEDWTVTKDDDYSYYYNEEYMKVVRFIYDADTDTRKPYESDYYFLNLTNHYYGSERSGIGTKNLLKDGYYYASYCIVVDSNKEGYYDQFILDKDFNIVYSLSGNFGLSKDKLLEVDSVSYFDLAWSFVDGIGIVPLPSAQLRVIDEKGNILFNIDKTVTSAAYNNGVIIATTLNTKGETIYAVYDITGKEIVPFSAGYTEINPFLGYYTTAKKDGKLVLLSKDGVVVEKMSDNETEPFSDIAKTGLYRLGCYVYKEVRPNAEGVETKYVGVKNLSTDVNNNIVMEANMLETTQIYVPKATPDQIFIFARFEGRDEIVIYKLTTDKE